MAMDGVLDEALEALSDRAPDFSNGNTNHAPMVAETLVTLGRSDVVLRWVDAYRRDVPERPSERPSVGADWREALGRRDLWPEWVSLFRRELSEMPWQQALDKWTGRLAAGLSGEATHGLIRTAHAVRALELGASPLRLNELADGLAYWAAGYHAFRAVPASNQAYGLDEALARVPMLAPDRSGNIDQTLRRLNDMPEFAPVIDSLAISDDPLADLSDLTRRFAAVYLANADDPGATFAVVHAVTGPSALRLIAPYVSEANQRLLVRYAWQTAAAIYAVFARERRAARGDAGAAARPLLIEAAVENGAAHAIKFVEACLREYETKADSVFLAAAADAAVRLEG